MVVAERERRVRGPIPGGSRIDRSLTSEQYREQVRLKAAPVYNKVLEDEAAPQETRDAVEAIFRGEKGLVEISGRLVEELLDAKVLVPGAYTANQLDDPGFSDIREKIHEDGHSEYLRAFSYRVMFPDVVSGDHHWFGDATIRAGIKTGGLIDFEHWTLSRSVMLTAPGRVKSR